MTKMNFKTNWPPIVCIRKFGVLTFLIVIYGCVKFTYVSLSLQSLEATQIIIEENILTYETCRLVSPGLDTLNLNLEMGKARYDNQRMVRIYDFYQTGSEWEALVSRYKICFATQASVEKLYWLADLLENWSAPLSLAVYLTTEEEWIIFNLFRCYLSTCHKGFNQQVSLHLAIPSVVDHAFKVDGSFLMQYCNVTKQSWHDVFTYGKTCPEAKSYLKYLLNTFKTTESTKLKLKEVYPQNHMRNLARKSCGSAWTYSADIDIIPRKGMADMLQHFYDQQKDSPCKKCAFVIPTFELNETVPFPQSKEEIVKEFHDGIARPFHVKIYSKGHYATDYKKWVETHVNEGPVQISHSIISDKIFDYEPFYISSDAVSPFDERFLGYGFTRSSQFQAAFIGGWNFSVLTPVYSIHWGLQTAATLESPKKRGVGGKVRLSQIGKNSRLFSKIWKELKLKHDLGTL